MWRPCAIIWHEWPHSASVYTFVPPVCRNVLSQRPMMDVQPQLMCSFDNEEQHEQTLMTIVKAHLHMKLKTDHVVIIPCFSNRCCWTTREMKAFHENAATPGMIRDGMDINPSQVPVLVVDQPLCAIAKTCNGPSMKYNGKINSWWWLEGSFWNFLERAFEDCGIEMSFDDCVSVVCKEKLTLQYWLRIYKYQQIILMSIRSHRERKSNSRSHLSEACPTILCFRPPKLCLVGSCRTRDLEDPPPLSSRSLMQDIGR